MRKQIHTQSKLRFCKIYIKSSFMTRQVNAFGQPMVIQMKCQAVELVQGFEERVVFNCGSVSHSDGGERVIVRILTERPLGQNQLHGNRPHESLSETCCNSEHFTVHSPSFLTRNSILNTGIQILVLIDTNTFLIHYCF